jgi:hypothetical protein
MMLITLLIGGIIAQQGIFHRRKFGADACVVDMVGIRLYAKSPCWSSPSCLRAGLAARTRPSSGR